MNIAIIDLLGLTYDGTTLDKRGLGGSESAVILISKELVKVGFDVTVYNNCIDSEAEPGEYDGVTFIDHSQFTNDVEYDIIISSRSVYPFFANNKYAEMCARAKHKVVWMHDTFCEGDEHIENMLNQGIIDELFTLSDFHSTYVLNCEHGRKRNFEVMKHKVFQTRNGAVKYFDEIDLSKKDKNHFVYNASVTKGLNPLLQDIWPEVKRQIPKAHLTVIGGFYRFREGAEPDAQEKDHRKYVETYPKELDVTFTGVIPQKDIAEILMNATFMLYPTEFPETFGISTLESLLYKTPVITSTFGALEETAIDLACYKQNYANMPNGLFPHINRKEQAQSFIDMTIRAYHDHYLLQQKQNYCDVINDIYSWHTVALQWKQHLYFRLNEYLPVTDYRQVSTINTKVKRIYKRRFENTVERIEYNSHNPEKRIVIISPFWNADDYIVKHCQSVDQQDYSNYIHVLIDDLSDNEISLPISDKRIIIRQEERRGCIFNQMRAVYEYVKDDDIVILLDGDDFLANNPTIFKYYNELYHEGFEFTYGSMWSMADNIPLIAQDYPQKVKDDQSYRTHLFNWNIPYTHLRTVSGKYIRNIKHEQFKVNGKHMMSGADNPLFYKLIEQVPPKRIKAVKEIVCYYNDLNPLNDYKVNAEEQNKNAYTSYENREKTKMKKILIAVPTNKGIEPETFESIYNMDIPDGCVTEFRHFFGYQIDQIRNLIAEWGKGYDYVLCVDSDMILPKETLIKLFNADKDIVTGVYQQRKDDDVILELYKDTPNGQKNIKPNELEHGLMKVSACGFGCVLVKGNVFNEMKYPHFVYRSAIDHSETYSEDTYFCNEARKNGFEVWADTTIICGHKGTQIYKPQIVYHEKTNNSDTESRLRELSEMDLFPPEHVEYLNEIKTNYKPKVIYDIGACVLHWTNAAEKVWPDAEIVAFEAMDECRFLYEEKGIKHVCAVLGDKKRIVDFYKNKEHPAGNSYYLQNEEIAPETPEYFNKSHKTQVGLMPLDWVVENHDLPKPDMIKIDVQGAELDVLKGATKTLRTVNHVILELQEVEYNKGAPHRDKVIEWMDDNNFTFVKQFTNYGPDGDYHFIRRLRDDIAKFKS